MITNISIVKKSFATTFLSKFFGKIEIFSANNLHDVFLNKISLKKKLIYCIKKITNHL